MQINEVYEVYQYGIAYIALCCILVLTACSVWVSPFGKLCRDVLSSIWSSFRKTGVFGKVLLSVFVIGMAQYGATKGGFWRKVTSGGGDEPLLVSGIYTAVSNDVQVIVEPTYEQQEVVDGEGNVTTNTVMTDSGEAVTNEIHLVRVEWFGEGGSEETPVSIRAAETNEWAEIEKISPRVFMDDVTNVLEFVSTGNFDTFAYWWFGVDLPAIIVTTEGIEIRDFIVTSENVTISFISDEKNATEFVIRRRLVGVSGADWEEVGIATAKYGKVITWSGEMFTVDKTYDWQVITVIEEGANE